MTEGAQLRRDKHLPVAFVRRDVVAIRCRFPHTVGHAVLTPRVLRQVRFAPPLPARSVERVPLSLLVVAFRALVFVGVELTVPVLLLKGRAAWVFARPTRTGRHVLTGRYAP